MAFVAGAAAVMSIRAVIQLRLYNRQPEGPYYHTRPSEMNEVLLKV